MNPIIENGIDNLVYKLTKKTRSRFGSEEEF